ncbi:MAG: 2-succinyl-5-enolpyruvyl-6-hydroxy-3-cyclohexene-1-carboxylic-acid synthase [Acidobacteriota bacterium]
MTTPALDRPTRSIEEPTTAGPRTDAAERDSIFDVWAATQAAWAVVLLRSLADAGVRDVVVSPGSRSTPFVAALDRVPQLRRHLAVDERTAAFFALGQARIIGGPSLLLCTSGTAAAHYLPAAIEAAASRVPLLALTADRPPELHHCEANQTIDQRRLFGVHARAAFDLGAADASLDGLRALRRLAAQAVAISRWPTAGPVQLNASARKPLEPPPTMPPALEARVADVVARPIARVSTPRCESDAAALDRIADRLRAARRPLVVAGPAPLERRAAFDGLCRLARVADLPIVAEAASQLRRRAADDEAASHFIDRLEVALDARPELPVEGEATTPDVVLQLGRPTTGGRLGRWLAATRAPIVALSEGGWPDASSLAVEMVFGEPQAALGGLARRLEASASVSAEEPGSTIDNAASARAGWLARLRRVEAGVSSAVEALDRAARTARRPLREGLVVRAAVRRLPAGGLLQIGNSLPIRHLDAWTNGEDLQADVLAQRGASGIDGAISGAAGAAQAARRPLLAVLGDLSAWHDLAGLSLAHGLAQPFVVLVLQNDGGRIFEQLPIAKRRGDLEAWTTPTGRDFASAAASQGAGHVAVHTFPELDRALDAAFAVATEPTRPLLIEAIVPPHDAAEAIDELRRTASPPELSSVTNSSESRA